MGDTGHVLYVGNLPEKYGIPAVEKSLKSLFGLYGTIMKCDVHKNYGFVHMKNKQEAMMAQEKLKGIELLGQRITVLDGKVNYKAQHAQANTSQETRHNVPVKLIVLNTKTLNMMGDDDAQRVLKNCFEPYGNVIACGIPTGRNFCFVHMENIQAARRAIDGLDGTMPFEHVKIKVKLAKDPLVTSFQPASEVIDKINAEHNVRKLGMVKAENVQKKPSYPHASVDINDVSDGAREYLALGSTHLKISELTGARISTRGRFLNNLERAKSTEKPLHLFIQGDTQQSVNQAVQKLQEMVKMSTVNKPNDPRECVSAEVEINDIPLEWHSGLFTTLKFNEISKSCGATVSLRGCYMTEENKIRNPGLKPSYLLIEGYTQHSVNAAIGRVQDLIQTKAAQTGNKLPQLESTMPEELQKPPAVVPGHRRPTQSHPLPAPYQQPNRDHIQSPPMVPHNFSNPPPTMASPPIGPHHFSIPPPSMVRPTLGLAGPPAFIQRNISHQPPQNIQHTRSRFSNAQPSQRRMESNVDVEFAEVDINDVPLVGRDLLTDVFTQSTIKTMSGATVTTSGRLMNESEKRNANPGEVPLHLVVQGPNKTSINMALGRIQTIIMNALKSQGSGSEKLKPFPNIRQNEQSLYVQLTPPDVPPEFNLVEKIKGVEDANFKHIEKQTKVTVTIQGSGSGNINPDTGKEAPEMMHIHLTHPAKSQVDQALALANDLMQTVQRQYEQFLISRKTAAAIARGAEGNSSSSTHVRQIGQESSSKHCVHMTNIPPHATIDDILQFFKPLIPETVFIEFEDNGKTKGAAHAEFESLIDAKKATLKNGFPIDNYVIRLRLDDGSSVIKDQQQLSEENRKNVQCTLCDVILWNVAEEKIKAHFEGSEHLQRLHEQNKGTAVDHKSGIKTVKRSGSDPGRDGARLDDDIYGISGKYPRISENRSSADSRPKPEGSMGYNNPLDYTNFNQAANNSGSNSDYKSPYDNMNRQDENVGNVHRESGANESNNRRHNIINPAMVDKAASSFHPNYKSNIHQPIAMSPPGYSNERFDEFHQQQHLLRGRTGVPHQMNTSAPHPMNTSAPHPMNTSAPHQMNTSTLPFQPPRMLPNSQRPKMQFPPW